jgi:hypothetical protein
LEPAEAAPNPDAEDVAAVLVDEPVPVFADALA